MKVKRVIVDKKPVTCNDCKFEYIWQCILKDKRLYPEDKGKIPGWCPLVTEDALNQRIAELELTITKARMYLAGVLVNAKINPSHDRDFSIINLINNADDILKEVKHE